VVFVVVISVSKVGSHCLSPVRRTTRDDFDSRPRLSAGEFPVRRLTARRWKDGCGRRGRPRPVN
jgi:hypothetical protein